MTLSLKACSHLENILGALTPAFLSYSASSHVRPLFCILPLTRVSSLSCHPDSRIFQGLGAVPRPWGPGRCLVFVLLLQTHSPAYSQDGHLMLLLVAHGGNTTVSFLILLPQTLQRHMWPIIPSLTVRSPLRCWALGLLPGVRSH